MPATLTLRNDGLSDFKYYRYDPSIGAAVIFVILFLASTSLHFYQMIRTKTWFMLAFSIGGAFEVVGYVGRAVSSTQYPNFTLGPYIIQSILLLVAPALFAASIYMQLARVVLMVDGDKELFIPRRWLTRIFVAGDVFSFLMQSSGGGMMATGSSSSINIGKIVVVAALVLQLLYFALFVLAGALFHFRIRSRPTKKSSSTPWQKHLFSLYFVSICIIVRSIVRIVEYAQGFSGYIVSHEVYLYVFDATLMLLAMITMNWVHPSEVMAAIRGHGRAVDKVIFTRRVILNRELST